MPELDKNLETVDLEGVEILSIGGPVHGQGSPPEGDYWTADNLRAMAEADAELQGELNPTVSVNPPKNKLGHIEQPAVGYLENLRLNKSSTKLIADVKNVPRQLAQLIRAGAYRSRSVELSAITSQKSGKKYDWVVTGMAWLGSKLPAVRTLDDAVALYADDGIEVRRVVSYAQGGDVVWDPESSLESIRSDLSEAINGVGAINPQYYVRDVSLDGKAIVCGSDWQDGWIVSFDRGTDGTVAVAPRSEWQMAEQTWIASAKEYESALLAGKNEGPADTRSSMPSRYTDEQRRKFAEATGLEADKVTDEVLEGAGVLEEKPEPPAPVAPSEGDGITKLEARLSATERRLFESERDRVIESALHEGRFEPGQRTMWEKLYEADPESAVTAIRALAANTELAREYGSSEEGEPPTDEAEAALMKAYEADASVRLGISVEDLV